MIYGYARVSSTGQAKDGNSLEAQENALRERGCQKIVCEAFTGTTTHRPKFTELVESLQPGDTLMVTKLDRFSRTAAEGAMLVKDLQNRGVIIEILNMGRADNTPMGRLMVTMLLAFAEFEHDQLLQRFQDGKTVAKAHGKKTDGRHAIEVPDFQKFLEKQKRGEMTVVECCAAMGIARSTWYKKLAEQHLQ